MMALLWQPSRRHQSTSNGSRLHLLNRWHPK